LLLTTTKKKLQFLFDLPSRLNEFINNNNYSTAVKYYCKARRTLDHYKQMPSFQSIEDDCTLIIANLKSKLYVNVNSIGSSPELVVESFQLLIQLDEPVDKLCNEFMRRTEAYLENDLSILLLDIDLLEISKNKTKTTIDKTAMDILEFIDYGCNHFLTSLTSTLKMFQIIFKSNEESKMILNDLIRDYWLQYCDIVKKRFQAEQNLGENTIIVRAVDRFYRRIQTITKQMAQQIDLSIESIEIALYAAQIRTNFYLQVLKEHFNECLMDLRQNVSLQSSIQSADSNQVQQKKLQSFLDSTFKLIIEQIKNVLTNLQMFVASDVSFSSKVVFNDKFCREFVREKLVVGYLNYISERSKEFTNGSHDPVPNALLLILAKLCLEFESNGIGYLLTLTDEQFFINNNTELTKQKDIADEFRKVAKLLINYYVKVRGINLSQMIRKSVETRDWLNTIEPRNVRAVMKRIVEDFTSIDIQVAELFSNSNSDPRQKDKGSDSSKNTFSFSMTRPPMGGNRGNTAWSYTQSSNTNIDSKLMNNIQKLFADKIDIFSPVDFNQLSVLTGIIKITLKTFLECIRLKTFSKYGLQQIQVDCHYLQLYLWRFFTDENLIYMLLEEILTSTIHRCIEPILMEPRVVELICETV
jgi:vacuolar protein sorting-associated protein 51